MSAEKPIFDPANMLQESFALKVKRLTKMLNPVSGYIQAKKHSIIDAPKNVLRRSIMREKYRFIRDEYGIRVRFGTRTLHGDQITDYQRLNRDQADGVLDIIMDEANKYPASYIRTLSPNITSLRAGLNLARTYEEPNHPVVGQENWQSSHKRKKKQETIGGVYKSGLRLIFLNWDGQIDNFRPAFHHEIRHGFNQWLRDHRLDWTFDIIHTNLTTPYVGNSWDKIPFEEGLGFPHRYGRKDKEEDTATVMEALMTNPAGLKGKMDHDKVLLLKVGKLLFELEIVTEGKMGKKWTEAAMQTGKIPRWIEDHPFAGEMAWLHK